MQYQGGKVKIAKQIAEIINRNTDTNTTFVSLFCGVASVEAKVNAGCKILNDAHPYLIAMWKDAQAGREFPSVVSEADYHYIKAHQDDDMGLAGFVGFACSFAGKWWGGYARDSRGMNYAEVFLRSLNNAILALKPATFYNLDYMQVEIPRGAIIYCDPPYANTTGYQGTESFDEKTFWEYMRELSKDHLVFISEQRAPDGFVSIWETTKKRTMDVNKSTHFEAEEHLFIHESNLPRIKR